MRRQRCCHSRLADDTNAAMRMRAFVIGTRDRIAGAVYGTIVTLATLTAGAPAYQDDLWRLVVIVAASVLILWVAHVYAHGLGDSLRFERRLTLRNWERSRVARFRSPRRCSPSGGDRPWSRWTPAGAHRHMGRLRHRRGDARCTGPALRTAGAAGPSRHIRRCRRQRRPRADDRRGEGRRRPLRFRRWPRARVDVVGAM